MNLLLRILAVSSMLLVLLSGPCVSAPVTEDSVPLAGASSTVEDLKKSIATGYHLVMFSSDDCSHCVPLRSFFDDLKMQPASLHKNLASAASQVHFDVVPCNKSLDFCFGEQVYGVPAVVMYNNGLKLAALPIGAYNKAGLTEFYEEQLKKIPPIASVLSTKESVQAAIEPVEAVIEPVEAVIESQALPANVGEVIQLTDGNYKAALADGLWFVDFFAPWCSHCRKLAPVWKDLALRMAGDINIASIDCTQNPVACNAFSIRGFPTLKLFKNGFPEDYWGSRSIEALTDYVNRKLS